MEKIITRDQYLNGEYSHKNYYGQIVEELGLDYKPSECSVLAELLEQTPEERQKDEHLNSIELYRWDNIGRHLDHLENYSKVLKDRGESNTSAVRVFIIKEAMRRALNKYSN